MINDSMSPRDIYIELSDPAGKKKPVVNQHRVWDAKRFLASQRKQYSGEDVKPEDRLNVAVVSHDEYLKNRSH